MSSTSNIDTESGRTHGGQYGGRQTAGERIGFGLAVQDQSDVDRKSTVFNDQFLEQIKSAPRERRRRADLDSSDERRHWTFIIGSAATIKEPVPAGELEGRR